MLIKKISYNDSDLDYISLLLKRVWPNSNVGNIEYLKWLYLKNPNGRVFSFNVWNEDGIVAHYAAIPIYAKIHGNEEKGLLSVNTAIDPNFRGKGFFKKLALLTYEEGKSHGCKFVIGVSNHLSTKLFIRQLKFQFLAQLNVLVGFGEDVNLIAKNEPDFQINWTNETLAWRLERPDMQYFIKTSNNISKVFVNISYLNFKLKTEFAVFENLNLFNDLNHTKFNLLSRINPFRAWVGLDPNFNNNGFYFNVPEKIKKSPLNLIFRDLTDGMLVLDPNKVYFRLIDFDAY